VIKIVVIKMSSSEGGKKLQKSYFDVVGLCCSSEVPLIENILKPLQGIKEVSVIVPSRTVIVVHDTLLISQLQIGNLLTLPCLFPVFNFTFIMFMSPKTCFYHMVLIIKLMSSWQHFICGGLHVNIGLPFFDNDWTTLPWFKRKVLVLLPNSHIGRFFY